MFPICHSLLPLPPLPSSSFLRRPTTPPRLTSFPISSSSHPDPPPSKPTTRKNPAPLLKKKVPKRGRKSEAAAVEDFVRNSLQRTLNAIQDGEGGVLREEESVKEEEDAGKEERGGGVVEEDDPDWPVDAEVGWGVRASEYFEKHPIKNVVLEGGAEIDWEGELDVGWVDEINCLEWESFAFHPSPLIVLAFERYNRAAENWKALKELEEAIKVYWGAKNHLPPRTVKVDINIEKDMAYALKTLQCPQILFLRGNKIVYREKEFRTADELVKMIAYFYYKAKKPAWIDEAALAPKY